MKKLALFLASYLYSWAAMALPAHVQTPAGGAAGTATSIFINMGTVVAGNTLVMAWRYSGGGRTVTLSDTLTNSFTSNAIEAIDTVDSNSTTGIGFSLNITGGTDSAFTFGVSGGAVNLRCIGSEFSGVASASALDKTATAIGNGGNPASGAVTPTTDGQLLLAATHISLGETFTAGTDFALATTVPTPANTQRLALEYYVQPTAASHDGNFTLSAQVSSWGCVLATLKASAGAAVVPVQVTNGVVIRSGIVSGGILR